MGAWGTSIFSDDLSLDIRREYSILLSIGKENSEIEQMLINYYSSIFNCNNPDEDVFWFALALCEWKKGLLSDFVKEKALNALKSGRDLERWSNSEKNYKKRKKVLDELKNTIQAPMPERKKIKKPTVHHCPWKVGSLLAYKIISNKNLSNNPCFMKYVLLRVIKITKEPISKLFETKYYDESMWIGLYNWIGESIPDPEIVKELKYIPIEEESILPKPVGKIDWSLLETLPEESKDVVKNSLLNAFEPKPVMCVNFDWLPTKEKYGDITYLGCDESYQNSIPEFFKTSCPYIITSYLPFDIDLSKIMQKYLDNK